MRGLTIAITAFLVVVGAVLGLVGTLLVHAHWSIADVQASYGVLLAGLGNAAVVAFGRRSLDSDAGAVAPTAGWLLAVVVLAFGGPGGDVLEPGDRSTLVFFAVGVLGALVGGRLGVQSTRPPDR